MRNGKTRCGSEECSGCKGCAIPGQEWEKKGTTEQKNNKEREKKEKKKREKKNVVVNLCLLFACLLHLPVGCYTGIVWVRSA